MKIIFDKNIPLLEERLEAVASEVDYEGVPAADIDPEKVKDADAIVVRTRTRCDAGLLEGSRVRLVATATIGSDHIDKEWCRARGIRVVNAPGCNAPGVMQYVAASLRTAGFDPLRHTLGVVGKGNIGSLVARLYRNAGCKVLVSDPPAALSGRKDEDFISLEELLKRSDAITFHVPLTDGSQSDFPTLHMLNERNIGLLPPGAIVINASRGGVVAPSVITDCSKRYRMIIDTWPFEDRGEKAAAGMIQAPFISTPHIAGYSRQGKERATRSVIEEFNRFFSLEIPTESLADYSFRERDYALQEVAGSYNPLRDSEALKAAPGDFEKLRNRYAFREEP